MFRDGPSCPLPRIVGRAVVVLGVGAGLWLAGQAVASATENVPAAAGLSALNAPVIGELPVASTPVAAVMTQVGQPVAQVAAPVAQLAAPVVAPVVQVVSPVVQATAPAVQVVAPIAQVVAPVVARVVAPVVRAVPPLVTSLVSPLAETLTAVAVPVVDAVPPVVGALAPSTGVGTQVVDHSPAGAAGPTDTAPLRAAASTVGPRSAPGTLPGGSASTRPTTTPGSAPTGTPSTPVPAHPASPATTPAPSASSGHQGHDLGATLAPAAAADILTCFTAVADTARDAAGNTAFDPGFCPD